MKINFRTLLIIFLVAVLGSGIGTYASNEIIRNTRTKKDYQDPSFTTEQITYTDINASDLSKTINEAIETVVEINCTVTTSSFFYTTTGISAGSGVIISSDGYIVTNNHVIETAQDVTVKLYNGETYPAVIVGSDVRSDIGVIKIEANNLKFSSFADSSQLVLGQTAIAIGNPLGEGLACSDGIISALNKEIETKDVIIKVMQTTAAVNKGNSGGGLFDINGNIIGIVNAKSGNTSIDTSVEGMGYAIPSNHAKKIVEDIVKYGYVKDRATLGIQAYTGSNAYYYSKVEGVIVSSVSPGGAADLAGIKTGDVITAIDDSAITSYAELAKTLDGYEVGDKCTVTVYRDSKYIDYKLTLQEATN